MNGLNSATSPLLEWQRLIFVLPFGLGALLLLLSSFRGGRRAGIGHHVGHVGAGHTGHGFASQTAGHHSGHASGDPAGGPAHKDMGHTHDASRDGAAYGSTPLSIATVLFGVGRAPLPLVIEFFLISWGVAGFWALENLVPVPNPGLARMVPSLAIALLGGWIGSRGAAEVMGRLMPHEQSTVVSQDALFGLTGKVTFPVSEKSGRIHIYDEFGTLHDEMCRVPDGQPLIPRGTSVLIVDRDLSSGRLIVEESMPVIRPTDR